MEGETSFFVVLTHGMTPETPLNEAQWALRDMVGNFGGELGDAKPLPGKHTGYEVVVPAYHAHNLCLMVVQNGSFGRVRAYDTEGEARGALQTPAPAYQAA